MALIDIKNLTFSYDGSGENVFENVSLQLDSSWRLGLIGRNGRGKTTLLKLIYGELDSGGAVRRNVVCEFFPFAVSGDPTVAEVIAGSGDCEEWRVLRELDLLGMGGVGLDRLFYRLSHGERTKILLAVLFAKERAFLLIDEPTDHLDREGRRQVSEYLRKKSGFILVSHDKEFLDGCVDHILSIERASVELNACSLSAYLENKRKRDNAELNENARLRTEITRLKDASRRVADWADKTEKKKYGRQDSGLKPDRGYVGAKSAKVMKRATALKERAARSIEAKSALLKNTDTAAPLTVRGEKFFADTLVRVNGFVAVYDDREVNEPLSFTVERGERVALVGGNGSGKSSVIKAIIGRLGAFNGVADVASQLKISYVAQDTREVCGTVEEYVQRYGIDKTDFLCRLQRLGFDRERFVGRPETLSEGQKKKIIIAKSLCENAHLYVWDEPLDYMDMLAREQLKETLCGSDVTVLFVEHDAEFCDSVATKKVFVKKSAQRL